MLRFDTSCALRGSAGAWRRRWRLGGRVGTLKSAALALLSVWVVLWVVPSQVMAMDRRILEEAQERGVLRAGVRRDNPPHSFVDARGQWVGFDVDIAGALAEFMGLELKRVPVDELTRISFLLNGSIDISVASISHTWKRDEIIDFSQTYFWSFQTFLVRRDRITEPEQLVGETIAMSRGSHALGNWREWLATRGHSPAGGVIVEFTSKQAAVAAVLSGSVAGFAEDYTQLLNFARRDPKLRVLKDARIGTKQDGIGIAPNSSAMRDVINRALQQIERSGLYQEIYDRWFGPDSETPVPQAGRIEVWPDG